MGELNITGDVKELRRLLLQEGALSEADMAALKYLVLKYPYCQPLHFAYLAALKNSDEGNYEIYLSKASAYAPRRDVLYRFIYDRASFHVPDAITEIEEGKFIPRAEALRTTEEIANTIETVIPVSEALVIEDQPNEPPLPMDNGEFASETLTEHQSADTEEVQEAEIIEESDLAAVSTVPLPETSGEISGENAEQITPKATEEIGKEREEKVKVESIASSDYFVFNRSSIDPLQQERSKVAVGEAAAEEEKADVSKYDDYTLPYTFLWWLHKTRKEYADTYQPYVKNPGSLGKTFGKGELNQQIIENIFHIQPELNTFQAAQVATTVEFELRKKEDEIIEKFIREEPQIRPPQASKLDTENKARKSSEDNFELVSETLAKIYIDQMLYHKAIEIYKKLSLKFPDKNLYFAGQIEELEKKIS